MKNKILVLIAAQMMSTTAAWAGCELVKGGAKSPFDGSSLAGVQVEKKSLLALNKAFPALGVVEKSFKGEVVTCTACSETYVTCSE